ncbi:MAG: LamG-like jellyroll fold domain-containing protein [Planctomycetaceae bacterium]
MCWDSWATSRRTGFSYGAWIRLGEDDSGGIIAKIDAKNGYRGWDLWQQGKSIEVDIVDALSENAIKVATKDAVLITGQWQHVFATYDGSGRQRALKSSSTVMKCRSRSQLTRSSRMHPSIRRRL